MADQKCESALKRLREMFPHEQVIVSVRAVGDFVEWGVQVGANGKDFDEPTLRKAMAQVQKWWKGKGNK